MFELMGKKIYSQKFYFNWTYVLLFSAIDLSQALNPESMIPILANAGVQERLVKYLPEGQELPKTEDELRNTVSSPQFQQVGILVFLSDELQLMNWTNSSWLRINSFLKNKKVPDQTMHPV